MSNIMDTTSLKGNSEKLSQVRTDSTHEITQSLSIETFRSAEPSLQGKKGAQSKKQGSLRRMTTLSNMHRRLTLLEHQIVMSA